MAMQEPDRTNVFPCKHCSVVYFDMPSLIEHTESHLQQEEVRRFKCDKCGRGYRHAGSLANHKKTHDVGCFQCQICGKENSNALALKSHLRSHTSQKKYTCVDCGKAFRLATQLATHEKVHFSKRSHRQQPFQRSGVDYSASTNEIENDDSPRRDEQSSSAGISTGSSPVEEEEEEEMAEADGENEATDDAVNRPYKCDLCDKAYIHYRSLTNHKKTHQVGMFECTVCFKLFNNMAALYSHQRTHRNRRGVESASRDVMYTGTTPPHQFSPQSQEAQVNFCHLCQVLFPSDDEFQEHIQMHNSSVPYGLNQGSNNLSISYNNSINSPESTFYASPVNNIPSVSSSVENPGDFKQPREHAINNSRHAYSPRSSNQTATSMNTRGALSALNPVNEAEEGASAAESSGESSGDRRFKCQICGKSYRHSGSLINHKRCHQVGIYQCSICRKSYPHLAALRSHLRLHRAQPSSFSLASEGGDWLSSEPLTLDSQLGCFSPQEDEQQQQQQEEDDDDDDDEEEENENVMLGLDQEPAVHGAAYHAAFDQDFPQNGGEHLPHGRQPTQRHMCADCGETFADIAGIKSHCCPLLLVHHHHHQQQQQGAIPVANGYGGSTTTYHQGSNGLSAVPDPGVDSDFHGLRGTGGGGGGHDQSFFSEPDFHAGDVSDERLNGYAAKVEEEEDDGDLYQCSVCGNSYTNMAALRTHLRGHTQSHATPASSGPSSMATLRDEVKDDEPGEMMICSACGESFARRQDLLAHQLSHSATAPPSGGGRTRSSSRDRTNGVCGGEGRAVSSSQSVICGACGVFCTGSHHLRNHGCAAGGRDDGLASGEEKAEVNHVVNGAAGRFHADAGAVDRQYKCEQCGRSYRHAGSLLNHKKSHKTGVFRCLVCQKRFYNLLALKNHQRSHFDVKRHTCHECGKAFKIQKQLLNHLRRHKENQAKIQELNSQIQALMQMNGSTADGAEQRLRPAAVHRRRQPSRRPAASQTAVKSEESGDPRPFSCDQCGRSYRHAGSLVNHRNSHKTGEYCCSVCSNTYSNQLAMKNHLRTHLAHKKHSCQSCGRGFRGRKQLMTHVCAHLRKDAAGVQRRLKSKAFKCKECKQAFASGEQLAAHGCRGPPGAVAPGKEERPYACNVCDRSYRHAGSLLNHKNTHKTGHFSCGFCSKPFTNPMALRNHTRIHTQKKRYACPTCGKAFRLTSILLNHQKIHSRAANAAAAHISCSVCGKRFQGRSGLKRHRCRQEQGSSPRAGVRHADGGDKCFTCDLCGRSYRHAGSLLNHKKTHSESLHHCPLCLQTFPDPLTLQIHSQMKRHCCPECGKTFCLVAHLQGHMEVHSKDRPPPPPTTIPLHHHHQGAGVGHRQEPGGPGGSSAGRNLRWDSNRGAGGPEERRRRSAAPPTPPLSHSEIRPAGASAEEEQEKGHVCDRCGRTYRHAGSLLNHKNSHKTGSFSCAVCQKEFTNLMALKNHRRIHTEPKRYQCLECGKAFRVSTQLICHRRIHTKEKPFACPLCAKSFSSKSNLRHHQKLHQNALAYGSAFAVDDDGGSFMDLDMGSFL